MKYPKSSFGPGDDPNSFRVSIGNNKRAELLRSFDKLNSAGQERAVEAVKIIAGNPDYQKEKSPADGD